MESHKNKINLTFWATTRKYTLKKVFSVRLLYKSSVQKIKLNQNEFPMKHTQMKELFNHTIIMEKKFVKHCATLKHNTKYTSYYVVLDKTSNTTNRAYNVFKRYITQLSHSLCKWWPFLLCIRSQSLNLLGKLRHHKPAILVNTTLYRSSVF